MAKLGGVVCVVLMCMLVVALAPHAEAITCTDVFNSLRPCLPYVKKGATATVPPAACCNGIKNLINAAKTTVDRQAVCTCLKSLAGGVDPGRAGSLPDKCGVKVGYPISTKTDCSKIH